jgi:hypothetical protein
MDKDNFAQDLLDAYMKADTKDKTDFIQIYLKRVLELHTRPYIVTQEEIKNNG